MSCYLISSDISCDGKLDLVVAERQVQWMIESKFQWVIEISLQHLNFGLPLAKDRPLIIVKLTTILNELMRLNWKDDQYYSLMSSDFLLHLPMDRKGCEEVENKYVCNATFLPETVIQLGLWRKLIIPTFLHFCVIIYNFIMESILQFSIFLITI